MCARNMPIEPIRDCDIERFHGFVDRRGDDECWPWRASCYDDGRGHFSLRRKTFQAPRFAYYLATGVDPGDCLVCHTRNGNNPNCVNPRHLYLGTDLDNARDRVACRRQACGERNDRAKLMNVQVIEIRRWYASEPVSPTALARKYGVSRRTIVKIVNCETWKHISTASDTSASDTATPMPQLVPARGFGNADHNSADSVECTYQVVG